MKPPAFQFYADDFLGGTMHFTDAEAGLYIRLLAVQWSTGSLPDVDAELSSYGKGGTPIERVKAKFKKGDDGRLRNERLELERDKQAQWRHKSSEGGKKSADMRKGGSTTLPTNGQPFVNHPTNQRATLRSPLSTLQLPTPTPIKHTGAAAPKPPRVSSGIDPRALDVYNAYPLKVARPAALKAIVRALEAIPFEDLLAKTKAYAAARGVDLAFVPHPATWFNQQRYNDDPNTWRRSEAPIKPNPRNDGVFKPISTTNDFLAAQKRRQERDERERMAKKAFEDASASPGLALNGEGS